MEWILNAVRVAQTGAALNRDAPRNTQFYTRTSERSDLWTQIVD